MTKEEHQEALKANGCLGPAPEIQWYDYEKGEHFECIAQEVDEGTRQVIKLYSCYKNGLLPVAGGMLDQTQWFVNVVAYMDYIMCERDEIKRKLKA